MLSARPKVTDLVFQLYGRVLHPELFEEMRVDYEWEAATAAPGEFRA